MKLTKSFLAAASFAAVALGFSMQIQAADLGAPGPLSFSDYDMDGNGVISAKEFQTVREKREAALKAAGYQAKGMETAPSFSDLDANGDGGITPSELAAGQRVKQDKAPVIDKIKDMGMEKHK